MMDIQTSADAYNVQGRRQFTGAMSSCLLQVLQSSNNRTLYTVMLRLHALLRQKRFSQKPQLSTSFPLKDSSIWSF